MSSNAFTTFNHLLLKNDSFQYFPDRWENIQPKFNLEENNIQNEILSIESRIAFLKKIKFHISIAKTQIGKIYCQETGLTESRFEQEFSRVVDQLDHFSEFLSAGKLQPQYEDLVINGESRKFTRIYRPIGRVLVIGASNFPLAYSAIGGDVVSAIAAGCEVVVKAHPFHLGTSSLIANLIIKSATELALPNNIYLHYIDDISHYVTSKLLHSGFVKAIGFTGSLEVGRHLMDVCSSLENPIPIFAEMGSLNPVVVLDDELSTSPMNYAKMLAHSVTNDAGQFCTKPGIIFYPNTENGLKFKKGLINEIESLPHFHMLHPAIKNRYQTQVEELLNNNPIKILKKIPGKTDIEGDKLIVEIPADKFLQNKMFIKEVFGPCVKLVEFDSINQLNNLLTVFRGQLTGTIIGNDRDLGFFSVREKLEKICGRLIFNGIPTGVTVCETMQHGGPYPSSSDPRFTAVGSNSIWRFIRPVTFQNF